MIPPAQPLGPAGNMTIVSGPANSRPHSSINPGAAGAPGRTLLRSGSLLARLPVSGIGNEEKTVRRISSIRHESKLEDWSDLELKNAIRQERARSDGLQPSQNYTEQAEKIFPIVNETIDRRLGAWRIFAEESMQASEFLFQRQCRDDPADSAIPADLEVVKWAIRENRAAPPGRFGPNLLLSAAFYRSLRRLDESGHYRFLATDQQLLAGLHLLSNQIVEMQAGEGKTIAIAFAAVMHVVRGQRVHIHTANEYLAERDCRLLAPVYQSLGLTTGVILEPMDAAERRAAYGCDIVYGPVREFGFDYLRDNLVMTERESVQPELQVAIFDEADQALIDEGDTPLIIAGPPARVVQPWRRVNQAIGELVEIQQVLCHDFAAKLGRIPADSAEYATLLALALQAAPFDENLRNIARQQPRSYRRGQALLFPEGGDAPDPALTDQLYYLVDESRRFVTPTEKGLAFLGNLLGDFCPPQPRARQFGDTGPVLSRKTSRQLQLANQVYQSLRAHLLLEKDRDYVVTEDAVVILDPHTGRTKPDNLYRNGLQAALEAREGVTIHADCESLAQVSVQGFANLYQSIAGITGTAQAAAGEFRRRYLLNVVTIPPARDIRRAELPSRIYRNEMQKVDSVVEEVRLCLQFGRPVLVGVQSINFSRIVSDALTRSGIPHRVLNAVTTDEEADIVRSAGRSGVVTVATNLAGRGTDIVLDPQLDHVILRQWINFILEETLVKTGHVQVVCNSKEEAEVLSNTLRTRQELVVAQYHHDGRYCFSVTRTWRKTVSGSTGGNAETWEFGLGLHVINAEFSRFPRVATQLKGRSGRQGRFGSARQLLSWEDNWLLPLTRRKPVLGRQLTQESSGAVFQEGRPVERYILRRQEEAEAESAAVRSVASDYYAVSDAHTVAYYRWRKSTLGRSDIMGFLQAAVHDCAGRLVACYFPNLDTQDYDERFRSLADEARRIYGIDVAPLAGDSLDNLTELMEGELLTKLEGLKTVISGETLHSLARTLMLECGDQCWRDHLADLQQAVFTSAAEGHYHKAAVASYILHARDMWDDFQGKLQDTFLSRLLTFPLRLLAEESTGRLGGETGLEKMISLAM